MSSFSFEDAYDRITCPHSSGCGIYEEEYEVGGSTMDGELVLEVSCWNCEGQDHLTFDATEHEVSVPHAEIGDTFEVTDYISQIPAEEGDILTVTSIADNPLYSNEKPLIAVVKNRAEDSPYAVTAFSVDQFEYYNQDSFIKSE